MRTVLALAAILLLVACGPTTPAQPVDLSAITSRLDLLTSEVHVLQGQVEALEGTVEVLTQAAIALDGKVSQPIDLNKVNWMSFTGLVVRVSPADRPVSIEVGPCPDDQERGLNILLRSQTIASSFHPVAPGTYCLRALADDAWLEAGVTVVVQDGTFTEALLLPDQRSAEE